MCTVAEGVKRALLLQYLRPLHKFALGAYAWGTTVSQLLYRADIVLEQTTTTTARAHATPTSVFPTSAHAHATSVLAHFHTGDCSRSRASAWRACVFPTIPATY